MRLEFDRIINQINKVTIQTFKKYFLGFSYPDGEAPAIF